jgi:hypothetical protein
MARMILIGALFSLITVVCGTVFGRPLFYSDEELTKKADAVIVGEVTGIVKTDRIGTLFGDHRNKIYFATIRVDKVMKGAIKEGSAIIVESIEMIPFLEPDVQDAQFGVGNKGKAYLKILPDGHFKALGGWLKGWQK